MLAAVLVSGYAGVAAAHTPNASASCSSIQDEADLAVENLHIVASEDTVQVWTEDNGWPGLQTHEHTCKDGTQTRTIPSDALVVGV